MKTIGILFVSALLFAGCKKKEEPAAGSASGSSAMGSGMGSAAGSDTGSGSAMGSAAGSDMGSAAGSGSAMAGSGSAAAGSGSDTAAAGGGGIKDEADYEAKRTAAMDEMTAMYASDKDDCKKLASDMTAYAEKNQGMMKDAIAYEKAHADVKKKVDAKNKAKEKDMMAKMTPVLKKCGKDKDFMAAVKKMADMAK
jgi:hypothetical protein